MRDSGASLPWRLCSGALSSIFFLRQVCNDFASDPARGQPKSEIHLTHCATPAHWGRPTGPIFNESISSLIQPPRSQVHLRQQQHDPPARGQPTTHGRQRAATRVKSDSGASLLWRLCSGALFPIYTPPPPTDGRLAGDDFDSRKREASLCKLAVRGDEDNDGGQRQGDGKVLRVKE